MHPQAQPEPQSPQPADVRPPIAGDASITLPEVAWPRKAAAVEARATWFRLRSRRGLLNKTYIVRRCPECSEAHEFRTDGMRIAPCGVRLVIKARKGRVAK